MTLFTERAPAKINLYLHVTGKRADGYHLLDSLVVFADRGDGAADRISAEAAPDYRLVLTGPQAALLGDADPEKNLVTKALRRLAEKLQKKLAVAVTLHKVLPVASGIGGGSADAAAALRAVVRLWDVPLTHSALFEAAQETGADVPACLFNRPCYFGGIGEEITPLENIPALSLLLVNPAIPLPTVDVFRARQGPFTPPARFEVMPQTAEALAQALAVRRNDLEEPALTLCDAIADVLDEIRDQEGCLFARLSGSGATCFGIFRDDASARAAATRIRRRIGEWWVAVTGC